MANAVVPKWHGDNYQARIFWMNALNLMKPHTSVVEVTFEAEAPKAFDDVVVRFDPPVVYSGEQRVCADYHQIKWQVHGGHRFGYEDLIDPGFIHASTHSLLQRLQAAAETASGSAVFTFLTTARIKDGDPLGSLICNNDRSLLWERLFDNTKDQRRMGKVRKCWRDHLGLASDDSLEALVRRFRIMDGYRSLRELRELVNERAVSVGFCAYDNTASDFRYDELARQLKVRGLNRITKVSLQSLARDEGLLNKQTAPADPFLPVCIRSFLGPAADVIDAAPEHTLSLVGDFRQRYLHDNRSWQDDIQPKVVEFLQSMAKQSLKLRLTLDAHASIAFLAGSILHVKSALEVELVQKGRSGLRVWRPHDGSEVNGTRFNHRHKRPGSGQGIAVGLSVTQPVESATRAYIASNLLCVGDLLLFDLPGGPGQTTVMGGGHAAALAEQVSNTLREIKAADPDRTVHIFAACPNSLLFYLGQQSQGIAPAIVYEFDFDRKGNKSYQPSFLLG